MTREHAEKVNEIYSKIHNLEIELSQLPKDLTWIPKSLSFKCTKFKPTSKEPVIISTKIRQEDIPAVETLIEVLRERIYMEINVLVEELNAL